jgi:hypothetical protein
MGMDQQLDLKLDVKEAPAIPQYSGRLIFQGIFAILGGISTCLIIGCCADGLNH